MVNWPKYQIRAETVAGSFAVYPELLLSLLLFSLPLLFFDCSVSLPIVDFVLLRCAFSYSVWSEKFGIATRRVDYFFVPTILGVINPEHVLLRSFLDDFIDKQRRLLYRR